MLWIKLLKLRNKSFYKFSNWTFWIYSKCSSLSLSIFLFLPISLSLSLSLSVFPSFCSFLSHTRSRGDPISLINLADTSSLISNSSNSSRSNWNAGKSVAKDTSTLGLVWAILKSIGNKFSYESSLLGQIQKRSILKAKLV